MKTLPETPFNRAVDYSIICLLLGMVLESAALLAHHATIRQTGFNIPSTSLLVLLVLGLAYFWRQLFHKEQKLFTIAGISCYVMFIAQRFLQSIDLISDKVPHKILFVFFSFDVLVALFLVLFLFVRQFRKQFDNDKSPRYLLAGIGVVLLASSLVSMTMRPVSILLVLYCVIGLGCVLREPVMGVIGYWIMLTVWSWRVFMSISYGRSFIFSIGYACFLAALAIVLTKFLKNEFKWGPWKRFWGEMNRPSTSGSYTTSSFSQKKSCSRCGREVSILSRAGERCPHCGAYWSSEHQGGFRY